MGAKDLMIDPARVSLIVDALTVDPATRAGAKAVMELPAGNETGMVPFTIPTMAPQAPQYRPKITTPVAVLNSGAPGIIERAAARQKMLQSGVAPQDAEACITYATHKGWTMADLLDTVTAAPQRLRTVMEGVPNAPNPDAWMTWQYTGPNAAIAVPASGTVVATFQPAKGFNARALYIVAGTNLSADQDDLAVGTIKIGGNTYNNNGVVPSTIYRPSSNTYPGAPNFAGPWVPPNTTIEITLVNTNTVDPLSVLIGLGGPTS